MAKQRGGERKLDAEFGSALGFDIVSPFVGLCNITWKGIFRERPFIDYDGDVEAGDLVTDRHLGDVNRMSVASDG